MAGFGSLSAEDEAAMQPETFVNPAVKGLISGLADTVATPGKVMAPNPYPPGSEEASWFEDQRAKTGEDWSRNMALNTIGTGLPFAKPGAIGSAGGKLVQPSKPLVASSEMATPYHDLLEPPSQLAYNALHGYPDAKIPAAATDQAAGNVGGSVAGASGGGEGLQQAIAQAERRAAGRPPLPGLPTKEQIVDGELFTPGPVGSAHDVAERYMADKDFGSYFKTPKSFTSSTPSTRRRSRKPLMR